MEYLLSVLLKVSAHIIITQNKRELVEHSYWTPICSLYVPEMLQQKQDGILCISCARELLPDLSGDLFVFGVQTFRFLYTIIAY